MLDYALDLVVWAPIATGLFVLAVAAVGWLMDHCMNLRDTEDRR